MDHPSCSMASTSSSLMPYERLPYFLIQQIGDYLNLDDQLNFMASSPHVFKALKSKFRRFTYMQICDEYREMYVKGDGEKRIFSGQNLVQLLQICVNLQQVLIAVKPPLGPLPENSTNCPMFDTTLYYPNGYIGQFCKIAPSSLLSSLKTLSLNVDLTVNSFSELLIPCPVEDLYFAATHLASCSFNTFVQIGFCASVYNVNDGQMNRVYLNAMNHTCAKMNSMGCKAIIDVGANDGYVDLSVEVGRIEYSFAYFYYNPKICEPHGLNDEVDYGDEEEFSEFNEIVLAETFLQDYAHEKPVGFNCDLNNRDLYKFL